MSTVMQINPFDFFTDTHGDALDAGYIWIGEVNKDPRQYPVAIYYDEGLTIPAVQPLRTSGGYIVRSGAPTFLYIDERFSIIVQDSRGRQVYYVPSAPLAVGSGSVTFTQSGAGALQRTAEDKMRDIVTRGDFPTPQDAVIPALNKPYLVPDDSSIVLNVPTDVATLVDALSAVAEWSIPSSSLLTINLAESTTTSASTVIIDHPNAENMLIRGAANPVSCTITGYNSVAGGRGNYLVTLNVSNSSGLAIGHWVAIRDTVGTGRYRNLNGFYEVTAVPTGTTIQVRVRLWDAAFPVMTFSGGNVYRIRTLIKFQNKDGVVIRSSAATIYDVGIIGNMWDYWLESNITGTEKGTHGVYVSSNTIVDGAGTPGGANPYGLAGGALAAVGVHVADFDQQGFTAAGGAGIFGRNCYAASCGRRGIYVGTSASIEMKFCYISTCYRDGIIADYGGAFNGSLIYSNGNRLAGGFANNGASFISPNSEFTGNLFGIDIRAGSGGFVDASLLALNNQNGASFEYGAGGSLSGADLTDNTVDGLAIIFGASVRATNANINNNGRYGINSLGSYCGRSGATITGNTTANINADALSVIFDGTNYEPTGNPVPVYEWRVTDTTKAHTTRATVNTIGDFAFSLDGTPRWVMKADGTWHPSVDGGPTVGRAANRVNTYFGVNGAINTSDGTLKTPVRKMNSNEIAAGSELAEEFGIWQWLSKVSEEGEKARLHVGMTVQRAIEIMTKHELDPMAYGFICYDNWEDEYIDVPAIFESDENGVAQEIEPARRELVTPAGEIYSFRFNELQAFILGAQVQQIKDLKEQMQQVIGGKTA